MTEEKLYCPRRDEQPANFMFDGSMHWDPANCCSYCGSLNPDEFMKRLEANDIEIYMSDKNYKAYIHNRGGETFKQHYRNCPPSAKCKGPDDCDHWVTRDMDQTKFYFQHLHIKQQRRFVELLNSRQMGLRPLPFFVTR